MLTRILLIPFVVLAFIFLYLTLEVDENYAIYIIIPVVVAAMIWVLSPQIDWWWYQKNPPTLDPAITQLLERHHPYYQQLFFEDKKKFQTRVALFMVASDFSSPQGESVPEDIKGMISSSAVMLKFGFTDILYKDFEKIIVYPKPFPSPQYPRNFHASEIFVEDGVTLFSAQQVAQSFFKPKQFFDLPLYEYAKVFMATESENEFPKISQEQILNLELVSSLSLNKISQYINLPEKQIDYRAVSIHHFFLFPNEFRNQLPNLYNLYTSIFLQDPGHVSNVKLL